MIIDNARSLVADFHRVATGPREGQKVFMRQTIPAEPEVPRREVVEKLRLVAAEDEHFTCIEADVSCH
jgi:hypothetical protein